MSLLILCLSSNCLSLNSQKIKRINNRIKVITLGCSRNIVDSEVLIGQLKANNINFSHEDDSGNALPGGKQANVVIINTCGFIKDAKQESIDTILYYVREKQAGKIDKLIVTGCLSERYKTDLEKEIPEVDQYFGTNDLPRLLKTLNAGYKHNLTGKRQLTNPNHFAYLKISEGCNRKCSFCAIPLMRGKHISKPIDEIVAEARDLAKNGIKELILIAQDLSSYGTDIYGTRKLAELLKHLSDEALPYGKGLGGIEWIRLHYAYPAQFPLDALDVISERENICNYIDMPLQHITDNMLTAMRRGINKKGTIELVNKIRQKVQGIAFRTSLLVGFPGETEKDFEDLKQFVNNMKFERLGVFTYSHEEDTGAYSLKDNVQEKTKQQRADEIMKIQEDIALELNQNKVGKTLKVLFDRKEGEYFIGRTEFDSPEVDNEVLVNAEDGSIKIGEFADIKITGAEVHDLFGERLV